MKQAKGKIQLHISELYPHVTQLDPTMLASTAEFPFVLTAGQRRAETSNTIIRDASWDKKNKIASLYIHPDDAEKLTLKKGDNVKITTKTGQAETYVEITTIQRPGFVSLPNGIGLDYIAANGEITRVGVSPNELTSSDDRDFFAGTPWHKYVPARIEKIA